MKIAVLSDTHGLLRPELLARLEGVEAILHAGDVGARAVLERLQEIAPVYAVRGNNDWALPSLPRTRAVSPAARRCSGRVSPRAFPPMAATIRLAISTPPLPFLSPSYHAPLACQCFFGHLSKLGLSP